MEGGRREGWRSSQKLRSCTEVPMLVRNMYAERRRSADADAEAENDTPIME